MRLALSAVDQAGARTNWMSEHDSWSLEDGRTEAFDAWRAIFERISIKGGQETEHIQFASALYRSMLMPNLFSDADGRYLGFDGQIRRNTARRFYTDFSLWDSYRTTHPLYTLIVPERHLDLLWSLALMTVEGQGLPRWPLGSYDSETMLGTPANIVLGEAYIKGLRGFDEAQFTPFAVDMIAGQIDMNFGSPPIPETYDSMGYYPQEEVGRSVAWIQESAVADFALQHWRKTISVQRRLNGSMNGVIGLNIIMTLNRVSLWPNQATGPFPQSKVNPPGMTCMPKATHGSISGWHPMRPST